MLTLTTSFECQGAAGYAHLTAISGPGINYTYSLTRASDGQVVDQGGISRTQLPLDFDSLYDDEYQLRLEDTGDATNFGTAQFSLTCGYPNPGSGGGPNALTLDSLTHTDETAAGGDGTATIQATGGVAPLTAEVVELSRTQPASSGQPTEFDLLPAATYRVQVTDSSTPTPQVVGGTVTIKAYVAPVIGCQDEYADNYDPAATTGGTASCTYTPRWRSAWGPSGVAVAVPALPGQVKAYTEANLFIGFRPGHPLAADRPLGPPLKLRATVGPQGFAVFRLGPYLQRALGASDGAAGYRLDLNSPTAFTADLYVGYELRRPTGELLEHGYALNSAVPDAALLPQVLSPFAGAVPVWPGFDSYQIAVKVTDGTPYGRGVLISGPASDFDLLTLPCPTNPLPVAWLAPGGGYGYWVFQGRPVLSDDVGEGQNFTEASSGERRWSQRGEAHGTITASSGVFNGPQFGEGLRTLWASPQVWYMPDVAGGEWVPVTLDGGSFPVRRLGLARTEVTLKFIEARPHYVQGQ
ncbi:hypothetical protein [Hymenobacter cheonanensis]|uniref:hypothetical protein n=1 Tax=Hymenobacter sp. CA2-7 TaxID=3063993 RepID=UPI00271270B5|nr:hypothetical protein [Hymenobacter sp. CA2-7]MDO7888164.1 hypothetical protein [Hymenobacter sp. CA2-7]